MKNDRLKELSGQNDRQKLVDKMRADAEEIASQYESAMEAVRCGHKIDEGVFNSLRAAFQTASELGKTGAAAVGDKVKKASTAVTTVYRDKKAAGELRELMVNLKIIADKFDEIVRSSPTILKNDQQLAREMDYFRRVMVKMIQTMMSRKSLQEGATSTDDILKIIEEFENSSLDISRD